MIDTLSLAKKFKDSGMKKSYIASELKMTTASLRNKMNNKSVFDIEEVQAMTDLLDLSTEEVKEIFFSKKVAKTATKESV